MIDETAPLVFCKECQKCCRASGGKITLSKYDVERLRAAGFRPKVRKDKDVYKMVLVDGECCFRGPDGCVVPYGLRPLDCRTYPVHFVPDGKEFYRTIALDCPHWSEIPQEYIEYVTRLAKREFKRWTRKERTGYWV